MAVNLPADPADGYSATRRYAQNLSSYLSGRITVMAAGDVYRDEIVGPSDTLINRLQNASDYIDGLDSSVTDHNDSIVGGMYDGATEFAALKTAIDTAIAWIGTNTPKTAGDEARIHEITDAGVVTRLVFTSTQTAGLRTVLQAVVDLITIS